MSERDALRALSAELGHNPNLVQAAGGNTSLKENGVMWIKASGTWLSQALDRDIFIPLDLKQLTDALHRDDPDCESCVSFVRLDLSTTSLRPSIETSVHGLMQQNVVLHVHCVNSISLAIQNDAEAKLSSLLSKFNWAFVPYARPGLHLSKAIQKVLKPDTEVLVLGNHGLVVAANTVSDAQRLLEDVVASLAQPVLRNPKPDLERLTKISAKTNYRIPRDIACHGFAIALWSCRHAVNNVYYPDHAVFLGPAIPTNFGGKSMAIAMRGSGVLIHQDAGPSVEPMLRCLSDVFSRLTPKSSLRSLSEADVMALLNWDAETYRQSLAPV